MTDPIKTNTGTEVWGAKTEAQDIRLEAMEAFWKDVACGAVNKDHTHAYIRGYLTGVQNEAKRTIGRMQKHSQVKAQGG